jgi:hypothetical protein
MIANEKEVREFFEKVSFKGDIKNRIGTVIFTNGNEKYVNTLIRNLILSYQVVRDSQHESPTIAVFCSDKKAYESAQTLGMTSCFVNIPALCVDDAYDAASAGSEYYLRLCFVKIILVKYALQLGYDVLYIDPDMAFKKDCINELIEIKDDLTFSKYMYGTRGVFVNSNIMRVYPTSVTKEIFNFVIHRDLEKYLLMLPDSGDENFIQDRIALIGDVGKAVISNEYPAGGDTKNLNPLGIKMYHANCFVGLQNKINYLMDSGVWFNTN